MLSAVSWGPPFSEPKMLQINNSIRELLHKKKGCVLFLFFSGVPRFSCIYFRMFPFLVTVTTTGQHKRSTTKMLQIEFIPDQKSQHTAMLKSENTVFPLRLRKLHGAINIGMGCQSKVVMERALCKLCTTK